MISDEERRRVAKALREPSNPFDPHASLYAAFGTCAEAVVTTVPSDFYRHNNARLLNLEDPLEEIKDNASWFIRQYGCDGWCEEVSQLGRPL